VRWCSSCCSWIEAIRSRISSVSEVCSISDSSDHAPQRLIEAALLVGAEDAVARLGQLADRPEAEPSYGLGRELVGQVRAGDGATTGALRWGHPVILPTLSRSSAQLGALATT
jgi:hypothetical protein